MSAIVATLIADPAIACLSRPAIDKVAGAVKATDICILAENIAADLFLPAGVGRQEMKVLLADEPIDIIVQPVAGRRKKLLLSDMDSTLIAEECIDELAIQAGLGVQIASLTQRAMRGEIDFDEALRQRVGLLKNLPLSVIDEVIATRIHLNKGAQQLIATMRANGGYTALVSGGFTLFTQKIAEWVGFDEHHANILCHDDTILTGEVVEPILGAEAKQATLLKLCQKLRFEPDEVMAVGDGANDIAMLREAGSGVAFHAKPLVQQVAAMQINHGDLTALLYIQGYKDRDFAL